MAKKMITFSIRLDSELKEAMERLCENLGMSMGTAYTIYTKKCVNEQAIPFKVSYDPFYSESNQEFIRKSLESLNAGKGIPYNPLTEGKTVETTKVSKGGDHGNTVVTRGTGRL